MKALTTQQEANIKEICLQTKSHTRYYVTYGNNGQFSQEGYSKYYDRYSAKYSGKLNDEIYGYAQALEHIKELKNHVHDGKKPYANTEFYVKVETITETLIPISK